MPCCQRSIGSAPAVGPLRYAGGAARAVVAVSLAVAAANGTKLPGTRSRLLRAGAGLAEAGALARSELAELAVRTGERQNAAARLRLRRGLRPGNENERCESKQYCEPSELAEHMSLPMHAFRATS